MIDHITIVMPYYNQPEMLKEHIRCFKQYPQDVAKRYKVVLVDDCSPEYDAKTVLKQEGDIPLQVEVYRITENIPWNHGGARNLGMDQAPEGWCLLTDIDHVLPAKSADMLLRCDLDPTLIYQPDRWEWLSPNERRPIGRHVNSFIMTRELFWTIGGLDETLTGFWNGCSYPFRKHSKKISRWVALEGPYLVRYDEAVEQWGRDGSSFDIKTNPEMLQKQRRALKNYKPKILTQPWERTL